MEVVSYCLVENQKINTPLSIIALYEVFSKFGPEKKALVDSIDLVDS
jgi:hypothetical protein